MMRRRSDAAKAAPVQVQVELEVTATDALPEVEEGPAQKVHAPAKRETAALEETSEGGTVEVPRYSSAEFDALVTTTFSVDNLSETMEQIRDSLKAIHPSRMDRGEVIDALDRCQELSFEARRLLANAKAVFREYETDVEITMSSLNSAAIEVMEGEKTAGVRKKAITNDDVRGYVSQHFSDETRDINRRLNRAKYTVDALEDLHRAAVDRGHDLRAIVSAMRG